MRKLAFAIIALVVVALSAPGADAAPATKCTTTLFGATILGDLLVPAGKSCSLIQTTVTGNVTVQGTLFAERANISGNVTGNHAAAITLDLSTVGGNFVADHTTGGPNFLCATTFGGNVTIQQSSSGSYWQIGPETDGSIGAGGCLAGGGTIGGNLTFQNNLGGGDIKDNQIQGNLDCHNNTPAPNGEGNAVGGNAKGQCADFGT